MRDTKLAIVFLIVAFILGFASIFIVLPQEIISPIPDEIISPIPDEPPVHIKNPDTLGEEIRQSIDDALLEEMSKVAKITAYSCGGLKTEAEILMNCPSLFHHEKPRTATGTEPIPNKTVACDPANLGRTFYIEGIGIVKCTDTGGAITGAGRFDLYVSDVQEARQWGVKHVAYKEVL